jgi:hypothetical protein
MENDINNNEFLNNKNKYILKFTKKNIFHYDLLINDNNIKKRKYIFFYLFIKLYNYFLNYFFFKDVLISRNFLFTQHFLYKSFILFA